MPSPVTDNEDYKSGYIAGWNDCGRQFASSETKTNSSPNDAIWPPEMELQSMSGGGFQRVKYIRADLVQSERGLSDAALREGAAVLLQVAEMEEHNAAIFKGRWKKGAKSWSGDFIVRLRAEGIAKVREAMNAAPQEQGRMDDSTAALQAASPAVAAPDVEKGHTREGPRGDVTAVNLQAAATEGRDGDVGSGEDLNRVLPAPASAFSHDKKKIFRFGADRYEDDQPIHEVCVRAIDYDLLERELAALSKDYGNLVAEHSREVSALRKVNAALSAPSAMGDKDAERYRALKLVAPTIIHPCQPPLAQGGWHGRLRGAWGSTGIFASRIDVFADRVLAVLAEHPDSEADHDHSGYVKDKS